MEMALDNIRRTLAARGETGPYRIGVFAHGRHWPVTGMYPARPTPRPTPIPEPSKRRKGDEPPESASGGTETTKEKRRDG
jgi:hypothetical protein